MKTITESCRQEVQKRYCGFESIPLHQPVSRFQDIFMAGNGFEVLTKTAIVDSEQFAEDWDAMRMARPRDLSGTKTANIAYLCSQLRELVKIPPKKRLFPELTRSN